MENQTQKPLPRHSSSRDVIKKLALVSGSLFFSVLGILLVIHGSAAQSSMSSQEPALRIRALQAGAHQAGAPQSVPAFTVNSSEDNDLKDDKLTLREAILISNGDLPGEFSDLEKAQLSGCEFEGVTDNWMITGLCGKGFPETIFFSSTLTTITVSANPLPVIKDDATVISGTLGLPNIDAVNQVLTSTIVISANSVSIRGLSIYNSLPAHGDILVSHGKLVEIALNRLGLKSEGSCAGLNRQGGYGIKVATLDGGYNQGDEFSFIYGNTIGCHTGDGIVVSGSDQALIGVKPDLTEHPNWIGMDPASLALPNGGNGIHVMSAGAEAPELTGIYSSKIGNSGQHGVWLEGALAVDMMRNTVGLDAVGLNPAPNGLDGLHISGDVAAEHEVRENTISGNLGNGILIDATDESYFEVNYIGVNNRGGGNLPNQLNGVVLQNAASHNNFGAPPLLGAHQPDPPIPYNQYIQKNIGNGITIKNSSYNYFGPSNLIRYNLGAGVVVTGSVSTGNTILPMMVYENGGLPIDLGGDGHTPNDPGDADSGPNNLLNFPVITTVNGSVITGTVCLGCEIRVYQKVGNPAQAGGGGIMLGPVSSVGGVWSLDLASYINQPGLKPWEITMIAWKPDGDYGDTSEMVLQPQNIYLPLIVK